MWRLCSGVRARMGGRASTRKPSPTSRRQWNSDHRMPACTRGAAAQALVAYDEAIRLDTNHIGARNGRGNTNRALKRYDVAIADFDELIRLRPNYVYAHYNRGLTNVDMGRPDDAVRDFTSALGIDKDYAGAYAHRGMLHEKAGEREKAIADFRAALAAPPTKYESGPWAQRTARERLKTLGIDTP